MSEQTLITLYLVLTLTGYVVAFCAGGWLVGAVLERKGR